MGIIEKIKSLFKKKPQISKDLLEIDPKILRCSCSKYIIKHKLKINLKETN